MAAKLPGVGSNCTQTSIVILILSGPKLITQPKHSPKNCVVGCPYSNLLLHFSQTLHAPPSWDC